MKISKYAHNIHSHVLLAYHLYILVIHLYST